MNSSSALADLFVSTNMEYPRALNRLNRSSPVCRFARNRLCALVKPGLEVNSANLIEHLLDPRIKLGTSTPQSDPSSDYVFAVCGKFDAFRAGVGAC